MTTLLAAHRAVVDSERRAAFYRSWQAAFGMGATHPDSLKNLGMQFGNGDTERLRVYLGNAIEKRSTITDACASVNASIAPKAKTPARNSMSEVAASRKASADATTTAT